MLHCSILFAVLRSRGTDILNDRLFLREVQGKGGGLGSFGVTLTPNNLPFSRLIYRNHRFFGVQAGVGIRVVGAWGF